MICPKCKNEISDKSKFCNHCGTVLNKKWYQKNSPITIILMILALCFLAVAIFVFLSSGTSNTTNDQDLSNEVTITLSEFNSIENGMTYEQVVTIVGGEGTVLSEVNSKELGMHTVIYYYDGIQLGANANFTFQNNKLVTKAQLGLTD